MDIGQLINGKYRCVRVLGDGGMGTVYEAMHEGLGTRVAIKVLHGDLARRPGLVDRFLREARVSAQIRSSNVVRVTDVDRTEKGDAYIVMELLEGEALSSMLEREQKLAILKACDYTAQILEALEAAHGLGVVHRDLKPENVFVTFTAGKPVIKLIDFGIAKAHLESASGAKNLTVAGVVMGTAEYMAPEQAYSADKVDARSDLYAVGVMLYEMIAGVRPVHGEDARVIALKVERGEVQPLVHAAPDVPRELAGLVHRAMAARPELRFGSAAEMRLALESAAAAVKAGPGRAQKSSSPSPVPMPSPLPPRPVKGGGTVAAAPTYGMAAVGSAPQKTSPGDGGPPPYVMAAAGVSSPHASSPQYGSPPYVAPQTGGGRRARRKRSSAWVLGLLALVAGGGGVVALVVYNANGPDPAPTPRPAPTVPTITIDTASPGGTTETPSATPTGPGDTVAPLVHGPTVRPPVRPHPPPGASGSSVPSASVAHPVPPGIPGFPTAFPSNFPNPFASGSGVGPVIPIPTNLPFTIPGMPTNAPPPGPPPGNGGE